MATSFPGLSPTRQREPGNEVARFRSCSYGSNKKNKLEIKEEKFRNEKKQKFLKFKIRGDKV